MSLEVLIIAVCLQTIDGGDGCSQAARAYYAGNKGLQKFVGKTVDQVEEVTYGEYWFPVVAPFVSFATNQKATIRLTRHWSLEANHTDQLLKLQWSY